MRNIAFGILIFFGIQAFAQKKPFENVSLDAFLTETQYFSDNPKMLEFVWWLPREFWGVSYAQDSTVSEEDYKELLKMFQNFELFAVTQGEIGHFGGVTYYSREDVIDNLTIHYRGENLMVASEEEISSDFSNFIMIMQPMIANMLGQMGSNIHFILFKSIRGNEVLPINPLDSKNLEITLSEFNKTIELPLSSLLLEKRCPNDDKLYSGKWNYCPIHGENLILN
ncbi:hypothetical protein H4O20_09385 [Aequorivita sp. 609]|uniref:Uncharacterized protein n=1 Tax=Aequorivita xiaoshiensis TaxID=2874476 RepID=A0A9X1QZM6_9FLAO|nr:MULTISPECIES: hypothetical protein [Aequorivita]MBB6681654.1 hypothetical protein [Aequorivita sp. 609]MCG2429626.1 hypothetical protein [Aequorivita xiaoshiensis]